MQWYDNLVYRWKHRGSEPIQQQEGEKVESSWNKHYFNGAYNNIEVVRRGTDLLVDSASEVNVDIKGRIAGIYPRTTDPKDTTKPVHVRQKSLDLLLNYVPNPYEDMNQYRRELYMDLVLTGNCYEYYDGVNMYQLPALLMTVHTGDKKKITGYSMNSGDKQIEFKVNEIVHTRDNSSTSTVTGTTRLISCMHSIEILNRMLSFQNKFFENGAVPGLILTTENALGQRIKQKMTANMVSEFGAAKGGKKPMILDGGLKPYPLISGNFKELDFENSIDKIEHKILKALGVPPILLDGGNNANIRPNLQLLYETTVLPMCKKHIAAYEAFFGYDLEPDVSEIRALRPELRDASAYYQGLVNSGIMTINEARVELRMPKSTEEHADKLIVPVNIAGSASNPAEGGRPEGEEEDPDKKDPKEEEEK